MLPELGEVWAITHARKGRLTVRFVSWTDDEWIVLELLEGKPHYTSNEVRLGLFSGNPPRAGDLFEARAELITWERRLDPQCDAVLVEGEEL